MRMDKSHIVSSSIGAILGACSIWGICALSGSNPASLFSKKAELTMYEKVADDPNGDVYITPKGKNIIPPGVMSLENQMKLNRLHILLSSKWAIRHAGNANLI